MDEEDACVAQGDHLPLQPVVAPQPTDSVSDGQKKGASNEAAAGQQDQNSSNWEMQRLVHLQQLQQQQEDQVIVKRRML